MTEYAERLKISEKMTDVITGCRDYVWTFLHGSVQCGKSVTAALSLSLIIEDSKPEDNLFATIGYTESSAINNFWKCGGFGIENYFGTCAKRGKYPGTNINCLKIKTKNGMKYVLAFGGNTKTSGNAFHGFRISAFGVDELDRLTPEVIDEIKQRITAVEDPHVICTMNPNVPKHPVYELMDNFIDKGVGFRTNWVLDDNVGLSPEKIQAVKDMYDPDSAYYKRYILGLSLNPESQIYNIRDYNIIDSFNPDDYLEYVIVCDQGESISASGFILAALKYDNVKYQYTLDILKHYYYKNAGKSNAEVKMFKDTAQDLANFVKESIDLMHKYPKIVYIDQDIEFFRNVELEFRHAGLDSTNIRYVIKDEIDQRIKSGVNLLYKGRLRFYKECKEVIDDFKCAVYDMDRIERYGKFERLKEYNELGHLDMIDCVEYAFTHYKNNLYIN